MYLAMRAKIVTYCKLVYSGFLNTTFRLLIILFYILYLAADQQNSYSDHVTGILKGSLWMF